MPTRMSEAGFSLTCPGANPTNSGFTSTTLLMKEDIVCLQRFENALDYLL
jgi:hypothetical protein